jgi:hypothetical protein
MSAQPKQRNEVYQRITHNMQILGAMLVFGAIYIGWLSYVGAISSSNRLDGTLGILLGLFIGSQPAANMLDILLFMKADTRESLISTNTGRFWLFMNLLTIFAAWAVVFTGALRFVSVSN